MRKVSQANDNQKVDSCKVDRLEFYNFKSYFGKLVVGPFSNFSCIVGPNGSGKSNIIEAFAFILGNFSIGPTTININNDNFTADHNETTIAATNVPSKHFSANMRCQKLEDLINHEALNNARAHHTAAECFVTIVFRSLPDISKEIRLTRRITTTPKAKLSDPTPHLSNYTTSSSEIFLNETRISEAEFSKVLRSLRVSPHINTFVILQHEVEDMAKKQGKERTELIEQLSGSAEYKEEYYKKRKELNQATEELTRVSMEKREAATEVMQMKMFKKDSDKFSEFSKKLTEKRKDLMMAELLFTELQLNKQKASIASVEKEVKTLERVMTSETDMAKMKKKYAERHSTYLDALKSNRKISFDQREKKQMLERVKCSIDFYQRKVAHLKLDLKRVQQESVVRSRENSRLATLLKQQEILLKSFDAECAAEDEKLTEGTLKNHLKPAQLKEYMELKREAEYKTLTQRQELEAARCECESVIQGLKQLQVMIKNNTISKQEIETLLERNEAKEKEVLKRKEDTTCMVKDLEERVVAARINLQRIQTGDAERQAELNKINEKLNEFRFFKENNRTMARTQEALKSLKTLHVGVRGRLVDLCEIPDDRYRNAVTVSFGRNLDAIVVDTTETAMACVRYLKEQRLPVMTFIPLNSVQGVAIDDNLRGLGGTCRPVADVIRYDVSLDPAIRYAVGRTLVCDTIEESRNIAFGHLSAKGGAARDDDDGTRDVSSSLPARGGGHKVVTIDGTVLLKNGSIQGGLATVQSHARKWDEKAYEELKAVKERLLNQQGKGEMEQGDARGRGSFEQTATARALSEVRELEARLESAKRRIDGASTEMSLIQVQKQSLTEEQRKITDRVEELIQKEKRLEYLVMQNEENIKRHETTMKAAKEVIFKDFQTRVGVENIADIETRDVQRLKIREEKRRQYITVIEKLRLSMEAETKIVMGAQQQPKDIEEQITEANKELNNAQRDFQKNKTTVTEVSKLAEEAAKNIIKIKAELDSLEAEIRNHGQNSQDNVQRFASLKKTLAVLNVNCNALRLQRLSLFQQSRIDDIDIDFSIAPTMGDKQSRRGDSAITSEPFSTYLDESFMETGGGPSTNNTKNNDSSELSGSSIRTATSGSAHHSATQDSDDQPSFSFSKTSQQVIIDFSKIPEILKEFTSDKLRFTAFKQKSEVTIVELECELDSIAPTLRANSHYSSSKDKLKQFASTFEATKEKQRVVLQEFHLIKETRRTKFMDFFEKLAHKVDKIYKELTISTRANNVHGSAFLTLENAEEPYNGITKYDAIPPMKRYMGIDSLSGGEKTMAALAFLFAIHALSATPFFVLDEVDAALDIGNVQKLAHYLYSHSDSCQFIVISLKEQLYHTAQTLVGVHKDCEKQTSTIVTLDLRQFD